MRNAESAILDERAPCQRTITGLRPAKLPSTPNAVRSTSSHNRRPAAIAIAISAGETPLDDEMRKAAATGRPAAT